MNKTLSIIGAGIIGIVLPVAGLSITPTREALLSLTTPDEKILALADKIDENRLSAEQTDAKIAELQSTIDSQQTKIEEQKTFNVDNQKIAKCAELRAANAMCNNQDYRKKLDDYLNKYLSDNVRPEDNAAAELEWKQTGTKNWNACRIVYEQCD